MTEVLLFHHAQGLTDGCLSFAEELRAAGHVVHTPDLYEGKTFADLDEGVELAEQIGFGAIMERGRLVAEGLPDDLVYAGFSLGTLPAQALTQGRPGARATLLFDGCNEVSAFGAPWPEGVPLQVHGMGDDEWFEVDVAEKLVESVEDAELFLYPGDKHLFTDNSLPAYDEHATRLLVQRVLEFLERVGPAGTP